MTESLPESGPSREIFLRSLREYSDNCQPPALTPGCPFAYDIEPGVRGCGEECIDILARYNAPPSIDEVFVDTGVSIRKQRRPRSRRGPSQPSRPFDVSEIYLTDKEIPDLSKRRMAALIEGLKRELAWQETQGEARRFENIERICNELERRHVDTESLIRYGFAHHIAMSVYVARVIADLVGGEVVSYPGMAAPGGWSEIIKPPAKEVNNKKTSWTLDSSVFSSLESWVRASKFEDVLRWVPPVNLSDFPSYPETTEKPEYQWLVDRFTETYLSSWRPSSLREEWKYIQGKRVTPCNSGDMSSRKVEELELGRTLVDHLLEGEENKGMGQSSAPNYVSLALKILEEGHRGTAAAVFEAASMLAPDNGELFNNWAFCLIPDNPDRALKLLDNAETLGMALGLTLIGNRLYCFLRTGRYTTGLTYAEDICSKWAVLVGENGYMWPIQGEPVVTRFNLRAYVLDLVEAIARATGDELIKNRWEKKIELMRKT